MTVTINQNYVNMFSANLFHLLEQKGSKLKGLFMEEAATGEKQFFDRLGSFTASEIVNRLEDVTLQDAAHSRRMATVKRYAASAYIDDIDKMKMLIDPTSDYAVKLANAHGRNFDQALIAAILGTAATGADGSGSQAFDTSNQQIAHGSAGLTAAKFHQALRILESNEVDMDGNLYLLVNARGIEDLMAETTFTSFDYQNMKPLAGKMVPEFRGVKIIRTERLPIAAASTYRAILCTPSTLKVGLNKNLEVRAAERPDLNFVQQISTYMHFGAVRMEEASVVDILFQ